MVWLSIYKRHHNKLILYNVSGYVCNRVPWEGKEMLCELVSDGRVKPRQFYWPTAWSGDIAVRITETIDARHQILISWRMFSGIAWSMAKRRSVSFPSQRQGCITWDVPFRVELNTASWRWCYRNINTHIAILEKNSLTNKVEGDVCTSTNPLV